MKRARLATPLLSGLVLLLLSAVGLASEDPRTSELAQGTLIPLSEVWGSPLQPTDLQFDEPIWRGQNAFRPPTRRPSSHRRAADSLFSGFDFFSTPQLTSSLAAVVGRLESQLRQATDAGLIFASPSALGTVVIKRSPIVHDDQTRGSRPGQSLRSGSYWVPARMDLDTALSKIDSRLIEDILVIRGPYSTTYGPGFRFVDFQLSRSPRYDSGFEWHGATVFDFTTNGGQLYRRQTIVAGDEDSGLRVGYGHRSGSDYDSGDGTEIPASFNSRDFDVAYGVDLSPGSSLEFTYNRLDQTDVELPGQAFDIDYLVTDAFELEFVTDELFASDSFELSGWYNRTELAGSAQRAGKRRQFPIYDTIAFDGFTDVDAMSTGYKAVWNWEHADTSLTAGTDLRFVRQELNEVTSANFGLNFWVDRNSPIPRAHQSNPGLFVELSHPIDSALTVTSGARLDWVSSNIDDDPAKLADVAARSPVDTPLSLADVIGSSDFDRDFTLGSAFVMLEGKTDLCRTVTIAFGYAERAPAMTELYAAQPFMFLLQNGLNTVTGNPNLDKERLWQVDVGLKHDDGRLRSGINGFHSWINDYITFENIRTTPEQVGLKFVNTDLATLAGGEIYAEFDSNRWVTTFATLSYVEGRDHSRNGDAATVRATPGVPSTPTTQVAGVRGGASGAPPAAAEEPLPNMAPLMSRIGFRLHEPITTPRWSLELSARIVDNQDRVASSLLESVTPGFTVWDLRGYMQALDNLILVAGVENFTDKQYQEYLDYRSAGAGSLQVFQPGVNFYFGSELTY